MASEQFSLCWDNFHKNMSSGMNSLLQSEDLVDVTLAVEGKYLKAHKMVLSVCSPYFKELFRSNPCQHPIVFMKDVSYIAISDLLQFMYQGEVQVSQDNLTTFIKTAEALQIKGLTGDGNGSTDPDSETPQEKPLTRHVEETYKHSSRPKKQLPAPVVTTTPAPKRPRLSVSSNDSQSTPAPVTKTEPVTTPASNDSASVQFKVEPYDQSQAVTIPDDGDENFGDDTLDDNTVDDAEDYSMMEGDEPQAGTSTDGTGEGQVTGSHNHPPGLDAIRKAEFVALVKQCIVSQSDQSLKQIFNSVAELYLACAESRKSGCRGRAILPVNGNIDLLKVTQPHNHPADINIAKRLQFLHDLKRMVGTMRSASLRHVHEVVSSTYLKCAMLRELNCKASYVVEAADNDAALETYRCLASHNHPPNELALQSSRFMNDLEGAIQIIPGTTKEIFDQVIEGFLRCSNYRKTGCRGKGYVLEGKGQESFVLVNDHDHPPDYLLENRIKIMDTLKQYAATLPGRPIDIYNSVYLIYPEIKKVWPFARAVRTINKIRQELGFVK